MTDSAVAEVVGRLNAGSRRRYSLGQASGDGWHSVQEIASDRSILDGWHQTILERRVDGRPAVAAAGLAGQLSAWLAEVTVIPLVSEGRSFVIRPADVTLHWNADGWVDAASLGWPALVEADRLPETARGIAEVARPLLEARPYQGRFGRLAAWGMLADSILGQAAGWARQHSSDSHAACGLGTRLLDLVKQASGVPLRSRVDAYELDGGEVAVPIRSTCCLIYQVRERPESSIDGYCATCPLISDVDRVGPVMEGLREEQRLVAEGSASQRSPRS